MNTFQRIKLVATRDFMVTVSSKGFLIGVFIMPVMGLLLAVMISKILAQRGAQIAGEGAVYAPSSGVRGALRREPDPATIAARREAGRRAVAEQAMPGAGQAAAAAPPAANLTAPTFTL